MKRFVFLIMGLVLAFNLHAQGGVHNYFNPTTGLYIQVGYNSGYILYRIASPQYQFTRMNYIGLQNGLNYYGTNSFQVAITKDSGKICVLANNMQQWFNYCGQVPTPNPYSGRSGLNDNIRDREIITSKCPWCNGTGRITKNDHVPQYGLNNVTVEEKCRECGTRYYSTYTNHYHLDCGKCGGTGRLSH